MSYVSICRMLAARRCYDSGASVLDIAMKAGVSTRTIYRWLRAAFPTRRRRSK
jgi:transposase